MADSKIAADSDLFNTLGYKRKLRAPEIMSALTPTADIAVIAPGAKFGFQYSWIVTPRLLRSDC